MENEVFNHLHSLHSRGLRRSMPSTDRGPWEAGWHAQGCARGGLACGHSRVADDDTWALFGKRQQRPKPSVQETMGALCTSPLY